MCGERVERGTYDLLMVMRMRDVCGRRMLLACYIGDFW